MKLFVIDNYDSFTYNLVHMIGLDAEDITVKRNDQFDLDELEAYDKIIISPGPGIPSESGLTLKVIDRYAPFKSILGVCLGHQAIVESFGGKILNMNKVYHGVALSTKVLEDDYLFTGVANEFDSGRYHSWTADINMPDDLETIAVDVEGNVMAIRHRVLDVRGVQFHPESILTPEGSRILNNWITR